jgi:alpha-amylase
MTEILLAFEVHQPFRINKNFSEGAAKGKRIEDLFDLYFDNTWNKMIFERVAKKCYFPTNRIILDNIDRFKGERKKFKVAYSLSGVVVEECARWAPDLLDSFKQLAESGCVELICQTYFHSLASLFPAERGEFIDQVLMHKHLMRDLFGQVPTVFENTEFIYNNSIGQTIAKLGFSGIFTEGAERALGWRSPNYVYSAKGSKIKVLLRNYRLSDDISFRFSSRGWEGWPLTADRYAAWLSETPGQCINIFMDYETFGEHQWPETGIHDFLKWLPEKVIEHQNLQFSTPSEVLRHEPVGEIDVHDFDTLSWADLERSTNAWLGNDMQRTCYRGIRELEPYARKTGNEKIMRLFRFLQTSDNIYYMYTGGGGPGTVHGYFSQQPPVEAFWSFLRIQSDFYDKVAEHLSGPEKVLIRLLRVLPPDKAFHFHEGSHYINLSAHSLGEFLDTLKLAPERSIRFHIIFKHFERWIRHAIGDAKLADEIAKVDPDSPDPRQKIYNLINTNIAKLRQTRG